MNAIVNNANSCAENNSLALKSNSNDNTLSQKSSNQLQKSQAEPHCTDEHENSNISETAKNQASTNGSESNFIGVEKHRIKGPYLGGVHEGVNEQLIVNHMEKKGISPTFVSLFKSNAKSHRNDSPINSDNHTIFSSAEINKDQSVTLLNDNPIIHCSDEGNDLYMPKVSKDYTLTVNSPIQNAPTKISSSEIGNVPNMNNLEKDLSKENPSKCITPCPFILRRGWCIKGDRCDFSHQNLINAPQPRHMPGVSKSSVFCPFLRRKGFCLKGLRCDFSHAEPSPRSFVKPPPINGYLPHPPKNQNFFHDPFLHRSHQQSNFREPTSPFGGFQSALGSLDTRLRRIEVTSHVPPSNPNLFPLRNPPLSYRPQPLMQIPVYPPNRVPHW